jgi:uncharacterized membrane protein
MAKPRTIGNLIAPWRFLVFMAVLVIGVPIGARALGSWAAGAMIGFDVAALLFLLLCIRLLDDQPEVIREHARQNDANRLLLLVLTGIVIIVLLLAIAAEAVGHRPQTFTKGLIIGTLVLAWLFSNTIYALHYAHMAYMQAAKCTGFRFPETPTPLYWDFIYFAFTCGMAFATSDVIVTNQRVRKIVTIHCLAAFAFNIGVLAFTVNLLASGG